MSEARNVEVMTPPEDAHAGDTPEIRKARFNADHLTGLRESMEAKGLIPPEQMVQMELEAVKKLQGLLGDAVTPEYVQGSLPADLNPEHANGEQERIVETLGALDRANVKIPSLTLCNQKPTPPGSHGVPVPQLDRIQAEAEVVNHLTAAGLAFARLAPSQEALEEFNRRALLLIAAKPSENGHPVVQHHVAQKRVFLALPHTGHVELVTAMAAFCHSTTDPRFGINVADQCSSLLAYGFNIKWCDCISDPQGFDYFLLLHSDIFPHLDQGTIGNWVSVLIDELESHGYDAIHACSPIKDARGLTSTGVGRIDDEWAKIRRITVDELHELPETWDIDTLKTALPKMDQGPLVGHRLCLLSNTGVLLVKIGPWVDRFPGFTIKDRIVKYFPKTGMVIPNDVPCTASRSEYCYRAQVVPEDWGFGRWCAQNGLRVGCTRKVRVDHYGRQAFPNHQKWGQQKNDDYHFNNDIP